MLDNIVQIFTTVTSLDLTHDKKYYFERIFYLSIYKLLLNQITLINAREYPPLILLIPMEIMMWIDRKMLEKYENINHQIIEDINAEHRNLLMKFNEYNIQHRKEINNQKEVLRLNYQLQLQLHIAKTRVMASFMELCTVFINISTVVFINPFQFACLLIFIDSVISDMMHNVEVTEAKNKTAVKWENENIGLIGEFVGNSNIIYECLMEEEYLNKTKELVTSFYEIRREYSNSYKLNQINTDFECYYQRKVLLLTWIIPKRMFLTWIYTDLKEICYVFAQALIAYRDAQHRISELRADAIKNLDIKLIKNPKVDICLLEKGVFLKIKPFSFSFQKKHIFTVKKEIVLPSQKWIALQGESGCGKTTLIYLIMKMIACKTNEIYFLGKHNVYDYDLIRRYVSFVKPNSDLFLGSIRFNMHFGVDMTNKDKIDKLTRKYMIRFGLEHVIGLLDNDISTLSTGEKQRLKIIRLLLHRKPIWLLDEITSNIDAHREDEIMQLLRDIQKKQKKTVIHITHNPMLLKFSDHKLQIKDKTFIFT
jgi:putative ABC transport system ATP-binding protein